MYTSMYTYVSVPSGLNFVWLLNCLFQRYMFCKFGMYMYMYIENFTCTCVKLWHVFQIIISYKRMIIKLKHFNITTTFIVSMSLPWVCIIQLIVHSVRNICHFSGLVNDSNMSAKKINTFLDIFLASKLSKSLKEAKKSSAVSDYVDTIRIKTVEGYKL